MNGTASDNNLAFAGIHIQGASVRDLESSRHQFLVKLGKLGLDRFVKANAAVDGERLSIGFQLRNEYADAWAPDGDTTKLCEKFGLDSQGISCDLEREILLAMLLCPNPIPFHFPNYSELAAAVRIRKNIVEAARKTTLAFDTNQAERPADCWTYTEGCGFTILPGKPMIMALQKATQPGVSGRLYAFSCYRATEYVILLGIAQELATGNPDLHYQLQRQWEQRSIMSGEYHEVFLREYGTMDEPLPKKYYVPGDRVWFRNPDEFSSDVTGYEGSWVLYLGGGLFTNFWKRDQPYTLASKCLELFHWRNATYRDQVGELQIDEEMVEELVRSTQEDPAEVERILGIMLRFREPKGVYVDGGCIDTSREHPRWVCPGTADLALPDQHAMIETGTTQRMSFG